MRLCSPQLSLEPACPRYFPCHCKESRDVNRSVAMQWRDAHCTVEAEGIQHAPRVKTLRDALIHDHSTLFISTHRVGRRAIPLAEIAKFPLILQGGLSGTGYVYSRFLDEQGVVLQKVLASNSLIAQIGLTLSGLGVSYLPRACLVRMLERRALVVVPTRPALPPVRYVAMHRAEQSHSLSAAVARLAAQSCDFSSNLLDPGN